MKSKEWLTMEHMVRLIERSIDRGATVEHDVKLVNLNSRTGRTRQCDIIIRSGNNPRETLTIVEVQKRNKKVELNTFDGWLKKMSDVGAHALICVSTKGFPASIKEKAKLEGGRVKLIWLKTEDVLNLPIKIFGFDFQIVNNIPTIISTPKILAAPKDISLVSQVKLKITDKVFNLNTQVHKISIEELIQDYIKNIKELINKKITVIIPEKDKGVMLFLEVNRKKIPVKVSFDFMLKEEVHLAPITIYNYEQEGNGTLAWTLKGEQTINNKKYTVTLPAIQNEDGTFKVYDLSFEIEMINAGKI